MLQYSYNLKKSLICIVIKQIYPVPVFLATGQPSTFICADSQLRCSSNFHQHQLPVSIFWRFYGCVWHPRNAYTLQQPQDCGKIIYVSWKILYLTSQRCHCHQISWNGTWRFIIFIIYQYNYLFSMCWFLSYRGSLVYFDRHYVVRGPENTPYAGNSSLSVFMCVNFQDQL